MLSRWADSLYWMSRYIERAENTARLLDAQIQASMIVGGAEQAQEQWRAFLELYELEGEYRSSREAVSQEGVLSFMLADASNPSSIVSALAAARENARAVRVTLSPELWEVVNSTWLELRALMRSPTWVRDPGRQLDWVKHQSHLFRGVMIGTMLKDEAYFFSRVGTFLERADNTARILDVKFVAHAHHLGQEQERADFYYWSSVLRSLSAFEIYRKVYRDVVSPLKIAELLIQRQEMPRSLLACLNELLVNLEQVAPRQGMQSVRLAGRMRANLQYLAVDEAFEPRIHLFLTEFLQSIHELGLAISDDFLVPLISQEWREAS
ncbi:MAG: hypothetical protein RLY30_921 [Pseudomonadota bacterium]